MDVTKCEHLSKVHCLQKECKKINENKEKKLTKQKANTWFKNKIE